MKKIINGKLYDTDTAECLAADHYGQSNDFSFWREELHRKKNGEYFLYGEGGPKSKYAKSTGRNWVVGSENISPFTEEQAREWAEEHCDGDKYIEIFGEVEE